VKIAFWSNVNERCGVTANMAAISVASVMRFPYTILALENRLCRINLGRAFLGTSSVEMLREGGTNYYDGGGIEGLLRRIYRGDYRSNILPFYRKEIIPEHLYYIPQSRVIHGEIFDYELNHDINTLFQLIEECSDICVIDTACRSNLSSKTILEEADLIVVNLCQNSMYLEDFFLNYSSLITKAVFLIGNYNLHSNISCRKISMIYDIPMENITVIPYNELFRNAFLNGYVVEFITSNYKSDKNNPNYLFIQSVKKAAYMIIKKAEQIYNLGGKELTHCGR
jgi:hypothetical protein